MNGVWLMALAIAFTALQGLLFGIFNLKKLTYQRAFSKKNAFCGETVELTEEIENRKKLPVPWLRAESRIPASLQIYGMQTENDDANGMYHKSLFFLPPMKKVKRHHRVHLLKRGVFDVGSVALTAGDLFSVVKRQLQISQKVEITVYPRLLSDDELPQSIHRFLGEQAVKRWIMPDPFLVSGVRDYRAGDSLRDVHWRQTARTGNLSVKMRDYTADPRAMIILNIQSASTQWTQVPPQLVNRMEWAISVAATLCLKALSMGTNAGFCSNAAFENGIDVRKSVFVPTRGGNEQADAIFSAMAKMSLYSTRAFPAYLESLVDLQGEDILILSFYADDEIYQAAERLRALGNTVEILVLKGDRTA